MTATYLLLLAKKRQGRPVRLRAECPVLDPTYSPLHDIQVSLPLFYTIFFLLNYFVKLSVLDLMLQVFFFSHIIGWLICFSRKKIY